MVNIANPLPAPDLPQMTSDYSISLNDLNVAGGVFVRVQLYEDAARGDYITVIWDNVPVKEVIVDDLSSDFPIVVVITNNLDVGSHYLRYTSQDVSGNTGVSTGVSVNILDGEPDIIYPSPVFTDAVSGIIDQNSIIVSAGTHVHVAPYAEIKANDTIILFWRGVNALGEVMDSGVDSHVILAADISLGTTFLISEGKLEILKDKGIVTASYQVRRNGVVMGVSTFSKATLDLSGSNNELRMMISTGAANTDYEAIHLYPFNQGEVKGLPGEAVILSSVGEAVFDESSTDTFQILLNELGESSFRLRSNVQGNVEISAESASNPGVTVQQLVRFGPYIKGNGNIQYLNYSTGAIANGVMPCSVYLKTAQSSGFRAEITMVRVTILNGSAVIDGYSRQTADIILNSDKSAEIGIVNSVAEIVNIELSLPESSGSINRFSIIFKSF